MFDLDETFIHCMDDSSKGSVKVAIKLANGVEVSVNLLLGWYKHQAIHSALPENSKRKV